METFEKVVIFLLVVLISLGGLLITVAWFTGWLGDDPLGIKGLFEA